MTDSPAAENVRAADVVINVGAHHAFGGVIEALQALHSAVRPAGRVLFGTEFWEHPPAPAQLASMWPGISANDCTSLAEVADQAVAAGFRPLRIETATQGEWEEFESGLAADAEEWHQAGQAAQHLVAGPPRSDGIRLLDPRTCQRVPGLIPSRRGSLTGCLCL